MSDHETRHSTRVTVYKAVMDRTQSTHAYISRDTPLGPVDVYPVFLKTIVGIEHVQVIENDLLIDFLRNEFKMNRCLQLESGDSRLGRWEIVSCTNLRVANDNLFITPVDDVTVFFVSSHQ